MIKFDESYNSESFCEFLRDFLPEDYSEKEKDMTELDRCKIVTKAKELGYSESLNLHILEMTHQKNTDPRVAIATDAFKILANYGIDRAVVIFKNNDSENYRFSYLTISLELNDKNKITQKYSNARRYSFYLGTGAKVNTPKQQLLNKGRVKDLDDLLFRFSLEVVNKEFYFEISKYFDELVSLEEENLYLPFETNNNIRKNFAVRLIGRIMFCWFLKQKKSEKGQLIPDEILSSQAVKNGYYHDILERLFFEVLNTPIDERNIKNEFYDKVPYIKGGLFSPQSEDYYDLDVAVGVSKNINTLKISDEWLKEFFELLETYNFTIDENTVFDQELSVDPEMLGRIFENLLAEISPETGLSERKRTGSFYTPRQIVEYMVDQSLIEYFTEKTEIEKEKISALVSYDEEDDLKHPLVDKDKEEIVNAITVLKILDPACGSGAFPIGVLQKLVYILQMVDPDGVLWRRKKLENTPELYRQKIEENFNSRDKNYIRKLEIIKNSIFGTDIQPIAVEVSRLRCFLTLVVDDQIDDSKKNRGIDPLPNLDFKFVCANTLIPAPDQEADKIGDQLFKDPFQEKFASTVDRYFSSSGVNKANANTEIHKLIDEKADQKMKYIQSLFSYGGDKKLESARAKMNEKQIKEHARAMTLWQSYKNIFENKPVDFFETKYFFPSVKEGFDIVIGNPPYVNARKIDMELKNVYKEIFNSASGQYDLYVLFIERSFEFLKQRGVMSFITPNKFLISSYGRNIRKMIVENYCLKDFVDHSRDKIFAEASVYPVVFVIQSYKCKNIEKQDDYNLLKIFGFEKEDPIIEKLDKIKTTLGNFCTIKETIHTGNIRSKLISKQQHNNKYYKLLRGKDCGRYTISWNNLFVNYNYLPNKQTGEYAHLITEDCFLGEKIFLREIALRPTAVYDNNDYFSLNKAYVIKPREDKNIDLKYLNGILNSNLIAYFFNKKFGDMRVSGGYLQFKKQFAEKIPVLINISVQSDISSLVDKIISTKKRNPEVDTSDLENQIDKFVYELYGLTDEEIKTIENN